MDGINSMYVTCNSHTTTIFHPQTFEYGGNPEWEKTNMLWQSQHWWHSKTDRSNYVVTAVDIEYELAVMMHIYYINIIEHYCDGASPPIPKKKPANHSNNYDEVILSAASIACNKCPLPHKLFHSLQIMYNLQHPCIFQFDRNNWAWIKPCALWDLLLYKYILESLSSWCATENNQCFSRIFFSCSPISDSSSSNYSRTHTAYQFRDEEGFNKFSFRIKRSPVTMTRSFWIHPRLCTSAHKIIINDM